MNNVFDATQKFRIHEFRAVTNNIVKIQFDNGARFNTILDTYISEIIHQSIATASVGIIRRNKEVRHPFPDVICYHIDLPNIVLVRLHIIYHTAYIRIKLALNRNQIRIG